MTEAGDSSALLSSSDSLDDARFAPGTVLQQRYRIVGMLGRGGMGEVYRAEDLTLRQPVALKFLPPDLDSGRQQVERMLHEVRMARHVAHPNVCRVYDIGGQLPDRFISMEYVDGEDLASVIRRLGRPSPDKASQIARQLCAGLAAAHDRGVLHRDLKPHNVMIDGSGKVRITDFGLAGLADNATHVGGTVAYMAPEQLRGEASSIQSDIYSLGLVLYELYTGTAAFKAETRAELLELRQSSPVLTPGAVLAELDATVEQVIMKCLHEDPSCRPASVLAVSAMLPGGDPLAAALAAGDTPSPELVAAAGESQSMSTARAVGCALAIVAGVACAVAMKSALSFVSVAPLDRSPVALADRARDMLVKLGFDESPRDTAMGYFPNWNYANWLERHDKLLRGDQVLSAARPGLMYFWYRQSPSKFRPVARWHARGNVSAVRPPWTTRGEAYVSLDLAGRLRRLFIIPGEKINGEDAVDQNDGPWRRLFDMAELDIGEFKEAKPTYQSGFRCDSRRAWVGTYPGQTDIELRVEAGVVDNKPAYFLFINPWDQKLDATEQAAVSPVQSMANTIEEWDSVISLIICMAMMFGAGYITFHPEYAGRGDRRGALRVAFFSYFAMLAGCFLSGDTIAPQGMDDVLRSMAAATFMCAGVWMCYLALEPVVRRSWPSMLIAWARLVSFRFKDPLVGKSVLVGVLVGVCFTLLELAASGMPHWLDGTMKATWRAFSASHLFHQTLAGMSFSVVVPVMFGFVYVLLLALLRSLLKRTLPTLVAFILVAMLIFDGNLAALPWGPVASLLSVIVLLVLFLRLGVLAGVVSLSCYMILNQAPLLADITSWFGHGTWLPLLLVGGMTLYGFLVATAGRPLALSHPTDQ